MKLKENLLKMPFQQIVSFWISNSSSFKVFNHLTYYNIISAKFQPKQRKKDIKPLKRLHFSLKHSKISQIEY
jgi:hypothetical protein